MPLSISLYFFTLKGGDVIDSQTIMDLYTILQKKNQFMKLYCAAIFDHHAGKWSLDGLISKQQHDVL